MIRLAAISLDRTNGLSVPIPAHVNGYSAALRAQPPRRLGHQLRHERGRDQRRAVIEAGMELDPKPERVV